MSVVVRAREVSDDPHLLDLLDEAEQERARRRADPHPFVTAHALLRRLVSDETGADPREVTFAKLCTTCGTTRHGKPHVVGMPDVHVSVSYGEHVVVAAVTRAGEIGVDIEDLPSADFDAFAAVTLDGDETAALTGLTGDLLLAARATLWARKEAVLKATGHGLVVDPTQVVVSAADAPARLVAWHAAEPPPGPTQVHDLELGRPGHRAAVAVLTASPVTVRVQRG